MYQIRLNLWSFSFKYTPPSFDLNSHFSSCLNKNLFKPLTFLTSLPTVLSSLPGPDQKDMWFFSKPSWTVIFSSRKRFCLVDVGFLLFAVISLQWCVSLLCVCLFLFYRFRFWTRGCQTAPHTCFLCAELGEGHSFLLSALGRVLEVFCHFPPLWAFEQDIGVSWAGWFLLCSPVQPRRSSETQWAWSSWLTSFSGFSFSWLFFLFVSPLHPAPHPISHSGYAVTAGHFSQPTATDVVGGAPQDGGIGKVRLFLKQ